MYKAFMNNISYTIMHDNNTNEHNLYDYIVASSFMNNISYVSIHDNNTNEHNI